MNTVYCDELLNLLKNSGIELSEKSGGQQFDSIDFSCARQESWGTTLYSSNADPIPMMDPLLFLKTLRFTEKTLKMKLFI
jgi:hypothetical protein